MKREIIALTSIRGIAALWVLFYHFLIPINRDVVCISCYIHFFEKAYLAVDLFFILSGYILSFVYYEKINKLKNGLNTSIFFLFLKARLSRVYPLHLFTLLILVLWSGLMCGIFPEYSILPRNNIETFIYNILLVHSWGVWGDASWNNPSWSISAEFFAYLIFPFFIVLVLRKYKQRIAILGMILIMMMIVFRHFYDSNSFGFGDGESLYRCLVEFIYGVLGFVITKENNFKPVRFLEKNFVQTVVVIALFGVIIFTPYDYLVILLFLPLIISISHDNGFLSGLLKYRWFHYLGMISYSIYLNHAVVLYIYRDIRGYFLETPASLGLMVESIIFVGLTVCTIFLSHFSYMYIENSLRYKLRAYR